jgi:anaerobic ribonucleoside-triphosphate reductase activating protein
MPCILQEKEDSMGGGDGAAFPPLPEGGGPHAANAVEPVTVALSRAHYPVTVLGHGRRIGLWFQGCSIGCAGCVARDTWDPDPARAITVDALVEFCVSTAEREPVDGVTISGGEPFDQPDALAALVAALRLWADDGGRDLLCYSGRSLRALRADFPRILAALDVVIPGPFQAERAPGGVLRGSANQELVPLTELGRRRYGDLVAAPADRPRLQVTAGDDGRLWTIGVPRPGDLETLDAALRRRGLIQTSASWRPPPE